MSALSIIGGVYVERCLWPAWDQVYGSGGRAACAVAAVLVDDVTLHTVADATVGARFAPAAEMHGFHVKAGARGQSLAFDYVHPMSTPRITPPLHRIERSPEVLVEAEHVLRFGMLETDARVSARRCVYDPQSAFGATPFHANGSRADHLAIVANQRQVVEISGDADPLRGARTLVETGAAEVVVVKAGPLGAIVVRPSSPVATVPPFISDRSFTIGSGDVFSAVFAATWAVAGADPVEAGTHASKAVAQYCGTMSLPIPDLETLERRAKGPASLKPGLVYLAGPFFTMSELWLVDEARRCLSELGMKVFSPVHEIGPGPATQVAPADLAALDRSDVVFAILDGLDSGTVFEVGYARARGTPVYGFAQRVGEEDLKMIEGSGCVVGTDFVSLLHRLAWRT